MKALWIRDLISQRYIIALCTVYSLLFFGLFTTVEASPGSLVYVVSGIASGLMITFGSFKADRNHTPVFMASLPLTRRDVVNQKYLLLISATAYGLLCATLFGGLFRLIGLTDQWVTGFDALRVLSGMGIVMVILPFYLRFGHKAVQIMMFTALALGVLAQVGLVVTTAISSKSIVSIIDSVLSWYGRTPLLQRNLIWLMIGASFAGASFVTSHIVYRRREIR
jgi:hypothetical protein